MAANSYKVLGQLAGVTSLSDLYSVPNSFMAYASVLGVCNQTTTTQTVRVAIRPAGQSILPKHYIIYDTPIGSSDTLTLTLGLSLGPLDVVSVSSSATGVSTILSGSEIVIDTTNVQSVYNIATAASVGMVRPDNTSISVTSGILSLIPGGAFTPATSSNLGAVRPDNTSIVVTSGIISVLLGDTNIAGILKPDGTSILVTSGVISANLSTISSALVTANTTIQSVSSTLYTVSSNLGTAIGSVSSNLYNYTALNLLTSVVTTVGTSSTVISGLNLTRYTQIQFYITDCISNNDAGIQLNGTLITGTSAAGGNMLGAFTTMDLLTGTFWSQGFSQNTTTPPFTGGGQRLAGGKVVVSNSTTGFTLSLSSGNFTTTGALIRIYGVR